MGTAHNNTNMTNSKNGYT